MKSNIPIGPTTVVGWSTAAIAFGLAAIAYLSGGHTAEETTAVELASAGLLSGVVTQIGRYLQAHKQIGTVAEDIEHAVGLTTPQIEALVERKLPQLIPAALADIGKTLGQQPQTPPGEQSK